VGGGTTESKVENDGRLTSQSLLYAEKFTGYWKVLGVLVCIGENLARLALGSVVVVDTGSM